MEKLLAERPAQVEKKLGKGSKVCIVSSDKVFRALHDHNVIIMACNTRIRHVIPGIMRAAQDLDAIVAFELAKSEGNLKGGYTGMDPFTYFDVIMEYADRVGFTMPFFIHGDHVTTKSKAPEVIADSRALIKAELEAGYTSIAIDASFNEVPDNIIVSTDLSKEIIEAGAGLEVEVGEIKSTGYEGEITSVAEAVDFINGLAANGVRPNLLAINNGSKHGNYNPGEDVHIDLKRTGEIFEAIRTSGVTIAQHGITGTPLELVGQFADYGIRKGNVGTNWQNIAHEGLPADLMKQMKDWCAAEGKDIKFATKQFYNEINSIPAEYAKKIEDDSYKSACDFIKAFRADGTTTTFLKSMG
ncbi:MAG: class II fructose-bisphosphate aldolase [Nitrospirae bacterium]|nr:class II fructose-bisphosphate aldolase [Nitrospirota bacterium]